jgi:nucleotidyltransferase substrate binding protein (TIGR01987 family)
MKIDNSRLALRKKEFLDALARLKEACNQPENSFMRDAVIQRFEFTYELAWKTIQLILAQKDIDVRNPKDALKAALEQGLITDGNLWSELHKNRNLTTHTYDEQQAEKIYLFVKKTAVNLFNSLAQQMSAQ